MQRIMIDSEPEMPDDQRIRFRLGINLGARMIDITVGVMLRPRSSFRGTNWSEKSSQMIERNLAVLEGLLPARRGSQALYHTRRSMGVGQRGPEQPLGGTTNELPPSPGHTDCPETCNDERRAAPRSAIDRREPLGLCFAYAQEKIFRW